MELQDFSLKMKEAVQISLGKEVTVNLNRILKNNGVCLEGMSILKEEQNVSPTIYINSFHEAYEAGAVFSDCVQKVIDLYQNNQMNGTVDLNFFLNYEEIKSRIVYKLIHFKRNKALLETVPYIPYLDLAIVFYCTVCENLMENATILIRKEHLKMWDVAVEELYAAAKENTPLLQPYEIKDMEEVIRAMLCRNLRAEYEKTREEPEEELSEEWLNNVVNQMLEDTRKGEEKLPMYVLSNHGKTYGASCLLYEKVLENFGKEQGKDFYILPSSIHEVLLIPAENLQSAEEFNTMVQEVNETQVEREEILSDHAYYYSRQTEQLTSLDNGIKI